MSTTTKRFDVRTEPLKAEIGDGLTLEFKPEVGGTEYLDAYQVLLDAQAEATSVAEENPGKAALMRVQATLEFLKSLATPETRVKLDDPDVVVPLRILTQVVEWLTGEYSGSDSEDEPAPKGGKGKAGGGARPTGRRSG